MALRSQIPKYLIVSGLNTVAAYGLFALFISVGFHYTLAALLPGVISIYLGYMANKHFVFQASSKSKLDIVYYYLFYLAIYLLNIVIQTLMHWRGFHNDYINGAIALMITTIIAFVINKWVFFNQKNE